MSDKAVLNRSVKQPAYFMTKRLWLVPLLFALCFPAHAQQPAKVPRIGFLLAPPASALAARLEAFRQGLRELGYVEGKNVVIEAPSPANSQSNSRRSLSSSSICKRRRKLV